MRGLAISRHAPVAQLDRVLGYEPSGREFESLRAHQSIKKGSYTEPFLIDAMLLRFVFSR
jgi:hypothetical protein